MCKKFKFDHTNKCHMHNPAAVLKKLLWDFHVHTDHLISARRIDLIKINKKKITCKFVDFAVPPDLRIKLKEWEKDKYIDLARELKKTMENAGVNYSNCNWCVWNRNWRINKGTGGLGSWRTSGNHPNYSIIENGKNTEKSHRKMCNACNEKRQTTWDWRNGTTKSRRY